MVFFWHGFFALLLVEAFTFFYTIGEIGFFLTLFLWAVAAALGLWLVRKQGMSALERLRAAPMRQVKSEDLEEGFYLLIAGLLFIFPGFISDLAGFALLLPRLRQFNRRAAQDTYSSYGPFGPAPRTGGEDIVEGVYEVVDDPIPDPRRIDGKP